MPIFRKQKISTFKPHQNTVVVLLTDNSSPLYDDPYGDFGDQGVKLMKTADTEEFVKDYFIVDCIREELPTIEWLQTNYNDGNGFLKGIYITGSVFDAYSELKWILKLKVLLSEIILTFKFDKLPPIVGICFGHQILSYAAGLRVDKNDKGCEIGVSSVELTDEGKLLFPLRNNLWISEIHNDIVYGTPPNDWHNFATTPMCQNQAFYKAGKMITFQGHPEFHNELAKLIFLEYFNEDGISKETYNQLVKDCDLKSNDGLLMASAMIKLFKNEI